jgi:hypothetical protein
MKNTVEYLCSHSIICKKLTGILPKELGSRKRIEIFVGVGVDGYYCVVMHLVKKSRILRKEADELMQLHQKLETYQDTKIKKKYIWIEAPLCSKAKALMESEGWRFL